ncbi:WD40-repeat-containing domain protein, partial [Chytriomyces sp. MP71]
DVQEREVQGNKRKRLEDAKVVRKTPLASLEAHAGFVSCVAFHGAEDGTLYSGGADQSVRVWDLETGKNLQNLGCDKPVLALAHSPLSHLLATGHTDATVRLWDPRAGATALVQRRLVSHKGWVPSVCWSDKSAYALASGGYDGTVKVWDVRSSTPLHTLRAEGEKEGKVLGVCWEEGVLLSGGEEGKVRVHDVRDE